MTNAVCRYDVDPRQWSRHVNDQAIVIGWAGYDAKVRYLPPEHFLALEFRTALWEACLHDSGAELAGCGPDGKLIVRLREDVGGFALEHVLVTLEHPEALSVFDLAERVSVVLANATGACATRTGAGRHWHDVELLVNPNGPLSDAGSEGQRPDRPQARDGLLRPAGAVRRRRDLRQASDPCRSVWGAEGAAARRGSGGKRRG